MISTTLMRSQTFCPGSPPFCTFLLTIGALAEILRSSQNMVVLGDVVKVTEEEYTINLVQTTSFPMAVPPSSQVYAVIVTWILVDGWKWRLKFIDSNSLACPSPAPLRCEQCRV